MEGWFGTTNEHEWTRIEAARAFQTRGTKVGWECQNNLLRLKDSVFFQYSGAQLTRAKAQATVCVPRVFPARDLLKGFPEHDRRYGGGEGDFSSQLSVFSSQFSVLSSQFSVLSSQFSVFSFQFSVFSFQFSVFSFRLGLGLGLFAVEGFPFAGTVVW